MTSIGLVSVMFNNGSISTMTTHDVKEFEVGEGSLELSDSSDRTRPDDGTLGQIFQRLVLVLETLLDDQGITRVGSLEYGREGKFVGEDGRDVLERMHNDIDLAGVESGLKLFSPEGLASQEVESLGPGKYTTRQR